MELGKTLYVIDRKNGVHGLSKIITKKKKSGSFIIENHLAKKEFHTMMPWKRHFVMAG